MAQVFIDTMIALRLVWFRVLMYFFLPMGSAFMAQTETWSGDTWDHTHWFLKARLVLGCSMPGCLALVAFIDSAMQKAKADVEVARQAKIFREVEIPGVIQTPPTEKP